MHLLAPAKINLYLRVGPPLADGFHPLDTWMCTVGLYDELTIEPDDRLELTCDDPSLPTGAENLVYRAAAALGAKVKIHLRKRIPAGGGLAGGSSDAARALLGIERLCALGMNSAQLSGVAAKLGSDVSFFLIGRSAVCRGVGEIVTSVIPPAARWGLLIIPPFGMPTPAVYRRFDEMKLGSQLSDRAFQGSWASLVAADLMTRLVNDLEAPAFDLNPQLAELRSECEQRLGRTVRMSGSGSTLFTLFDTQAEAESAAATVTLDHRVVELAPLFKDALT